MQRAPASGGPAGLAAPPAPTLTEALEQTRKVIDEKRTWYEALVLRKQTAEAHAGETASGVITSQVVDGFSFVVNAVNVDLLRPVCFGLEEFFAAVKGATAAREELIDLLSHCVSITSIVLNQALLADLPEHIMRALRGVEAEIKAINGNARLFDTKTGCSLPCRRLRLHAKDREEIQGHRVRLQEILNLATQAAVFDTNAVARQTQVAVADMLQGPPAPDMARIPKAALPLPKCYVARTSLLDDVVKLITASDSLRAPHALFGMGGSGKTVGDLTKAEARDLLMKQSGAAHLPEAEGNKVAEECGWLALALAIAGSLPSIRRNPDDLGAWRKLHSEITGMKRQRRGLRIAGDVTPNKSKSVLFPVLGLSVDQLGEDARNLFFHLVVLARGVPAPVDMLTNLWEQKDDLGTIKEADFLAGRSLLQKAQGGDYVFHDLMLDFVRMECDCRELESLVNGAVERQRQHLGRLAVLRRYSDVGEHLHTGLYALMSLWRSLEELSGTDRLAETYAASLKTIGDTVTESAGSAYFHVAKFFELLGKYSEAEPLYERCQAIEEKALGPEHPDLAITLNNRAQLLESQGKYSDAGPLYERCQAIQEKALGPEHPSLAITLNNRAQLLESQGKYSEAEPLYERCQAIVEKALGPEHPSLATTLNNRAQLLETQGKYGEAEPLYERCQAIQEKALGPEHPSLATTLHNRAYLLNGQGKYSEAEPLYERCQAIDEKALGPEHPSLATTLNNRAGLLESRGKYSEAEPLYERCQAIKEKALGPEHPSLATTLNNRAGLLESQGKYSEAEPLYERCQAIQEKALGPEHPSLATTLNNRAGLLESQGKYGEAEPLYERCQAIQEKALGPEHPSLAITLNNRAGLLESQGKYSEAEPLYERCQAIEEKALGPEHPSLAITLNNRASLLESQLATPQGKYSEAEPLYERCQAIDEKALGPEHPDLAITLNNRAGLLESQGKYSEAEPLYERCQAIQEKALGPEHPSLATTLNNRAGLLESQER
eukprot:g6974.t1